MEIRPIKRFVLLLDDPADTVTDGGIIVHRDFGSDSLDYYVLSVGTNERCPFDTGDRVIVSDPNCGRRLKIDGVPMRLVRVNEVIGVVE